MNNSFLALSYVFFPSYYGFNEKSDIGKTVEWLINFL